MQQKYQLNLSDLLDLLFLNILSIRFYCFQYQLQLMQNHRTYSPSSFSNFQRLLSINTKSSSKKQNRSRLLENARNVIVKINHQISERDQNQPQSQPQNEVQYFKKKISEMNEKINKLEKINYALIQKIKEFECSFIKVSSDMEQSFHKQKQLIKSNIFKSVSNYNQKQVLKLVDEIKNTEMTTFLEEKIKEFLKKMVCINESVMEKSKKKKSFQIEEIMDGKEINESHMEKESISKKYFSNNQTAQKEEYASIMQRLISSSKLRENRMINSQFLKDAPKVRQRGRSISSNEKGLSSKKRKRIFGA